MDIFTDQESKIENVRNSAGKMGMTLPKKEKVKVWIAKQNCKTCWGTGVVHHAPINSKSTNKLQCKCVKQKEVEIYTNVVDDM